MIKTLVAASDVIGPIVLTHPKNQAAALQSCHTGFPAGGVVIMEASMSLTDSEDFAWVTVSMTDPTTGAGAASLAAADKAGWADLPGFQRVRARRTDANGGNLTVCLETREG